MHQFSRESFRRFYRNCCLLLHDNEQRVIAYQSDTIATADNSAATTDNSAATIERSAAAKMQIEESIIIAIVRQNLTCASDEQCVMVHAQFADKQCELAINTIGAAKLAKAPADPTEINSCELYPDGAQAVCRDSFCTIE